MRPVRASVGGRGIAGAPVGVAVPGVARASLVAAAAGDSRHLDRHRPLVPGELPRANGERGFAVASGLDPASGLPLAAIGARFDGPSGERWRSTLIGKEPIGVGGANSTARAPSRASMFRDLGRAPRRTLAVGAVGEERNEQRLAGGAFFAHQ